MFVSLPILFPPNCICPLFELSDAGLLPNVGALMPPPKLKGALFKGDDELPNDMMGLAVVKLSPKLVVVVVRFDTSLIIAGFARFSVSCFDPNVSSFVGWLETGIVVVATFSVGCADEVPNETIAFTAGAVAVTLLVAIVLATVLSNTTLSEIGLEMGGVVDAVGLVPIAD